LDAAGRLSPKVVPATSTSPAMPKRYYASDPSLHYSPYNWHVTNESASTINSAAYVRFLFSGTFLRFHFDVSRMVTPTSEVLWTVDNGPPTLSVVIDTVAVAIPPNNTAMTVPYHTCELFVKSTTERANRWSASGNSTRIILTTIETDGLLAPWVPSDVNVLIYGDSITEGVLTLGASQLLDTDRNDASVVYSYVLGRLLGTEVGVVGFGANALTHPGSGGVPPLDEAWNQLWEGVPRAFTPMPDLIVLNEGTNDGCDTTRPGCVGLNITEAYAEFLGKLLGACPGVPIAVLLPFNGGQRGHIAAAVAAAGSPPEVHFIDTTGFYDLRLGGALHPTGPNDVARIAPKVAARLRPLLAKRIVARGVEVAFQGNLSEP